MTRVRVAVVGLGAITQSVHLPLLSRRRDLFDVVALVDLSTTQTDEIAARHGVAHEGRFRTLGELLTARAKGEIEVDGILLATTGSHAPEVCEAVAADVPVLSEKPLAVSLAELDAIEEATRATGRNAAEMVMVGYMKEHDPATARARKELSGKSLRSVTVEVLHPADAVQLEFARLLPAADDLDPGTVSELNQRTARAVDRALGGELPTDLRTMYTNVVLGSLVHDISLLRHLVGGVVDIDHAARWGSMPGSVEVSGTVAEGARLHVGWHYLPGYPDYRETVTFHHESGSVQLVFSVPYLLNSPTELTIVSHTSVDAGPNGEVRATHRWSQQEAFENELEAFHRLVVDSVQARSGVSESRDDVIVAQRIIAILARREGTPVSGEACQ
jgi:predicted dehydrogenase